MSGTRSGPRSWRRIGHPVDLVLAAFCLAMLAAMLRYIGDATIPYHLLFLAIGLVYGFRVWPLGRTAMVIGLVTLTTGAIFLRAYRAGLIELNEVSEILLMPMLLMAMIWHARRRDQAMRQAQRVAELNRELRHREHEGLRDASHALRTPTTIARGFVDLARVATGEPDVHEALAVIARQLDRTAVLGERLLALASLDTHGLRGLDMFDASATVDRVGAAWRCRGERTWLLKPGANNWVLGDESALADALDALLENALHHTVAGDTIRVTCRPDGESVVVEVADAGPGVAAADLDRVFQRFWHTTAPDGTAGSGLGLSMVRAVAEAHRGTASVDRAHEGGASFTLRLPRQGSPTPEFLIDLRHLTSSAPATAGPATAGPATAGIDSGAVRA